MKLTELLNAIGDEDIGVQNLDTCGIDLDMRGAETRIIFGTEQRLNLRGTEKLGLVIWLDRERVEEFVAKSKETPK